MRTIFFGSPEFAVPCLDALDALSEITAVISQPDRPAGRGLTVQAPAVKVRALELGLPVWQPEKVRTADFAERLRELDAEVGVVVAYGRILPRQVLEAPRAGCVNVHASLLPRWRGAAPIQWSIVHGDQQTGVTLMQMDEGMDTGPILAQASTPIDANEDAAALSARLSQMGASLLRSQLPRYVAGELVPRPQNEREATKAPMLTKADGWIDWDRPAIAVHNLVRGMHPWPGAQTMLGTRGIKIHRTRPASLALVPRDQRPGTVVSLGADGIEVACGEGALLIEELQESGRKRVEAQSFIRGRGIAVGDRFSSKGIEA